MVSKESLGAHSLFQFEGITWNEPTEGPIMKSEYFSRKTQNSVSRAGFGDGFIHRKKRNVYLNCMYNIKHTVKKQRILRRGLNSVSSWLWERDWIVWALVSCFFLNLVFLFYYLPWRRKRGKERNDDGFFLLDRKTEHLRSGTHHLQTMHQ